jgi:HEAT repeat protein
LELTQEMAMIQATSQSNSREQKLLALSYIGSVLEKGNPSDEVRLVLERLSLEGTKNRVIESGRLTNDFPDVRREAARQLGSVKTQDAQAALIRILNAENEPMVLQEAVKSLGLVSTEDSRAAIVAIVQVGNRFYNSAVPDDLLAFVAVDALDKIATRDNGLKDPEAIQFLNSMAEGPFVAAVKQRARQALDNLRQFM